MAAAVLRLRRLIYSAPPPVSYLRRTSPISTLSSPRFMASYENARDGVTGGISIRCKSSSLIHTKDRRFFLHKFGPGLRSFSSAEAPPHIVIAMPALSPTMTQGNIAKWIKKEGDKIGVGDVICEIETDKATLEFESLEEGFLAKILAPEGSKDVAVGQPIAITVEELDDIDKLPDSISTGTEAKEEKAETSVDLDSKKSVPKSTFSRISPSAKLLLLEYGLDASRIEASGPHGTLLKGDVLSAVKSGIGRSDKAPKSSQKTSFSSTENPQRSLPTTLTSQPEKTELDEDIPNTQIRKVIARRLLESKQNTPHFYLSSDVVLDPLIKFRKVLKEQHDIKVSVNDIVIKAVALALKCVPIANAYWDEQKGKSVLWDSVDISIAVATEKGLMTPIIRNADQKNLLEISSEVKELAEKARLGKLAPHEFQGGTFSISNLGMFPVDSFCAIINPPQCGILAVGRANKVVEPVIDDDGIEKPGVVTKMNLTLSADSRVFEGYVASKFLSVLSLNFSDIGRLFL